MSESKTVAGTIYIAPGNSQCRVYAMPYRMRPGQSPTDLLPEHQANWQHIALLDHRLDLVYLEANFHHLKQDIEGTMPGTIIEAEWVEKAA